MKGLKTGQVIVALILTPLILYTLWVATQAYNEVDDLAGATEFSDGERINGTLYRVIGTPSQPLPPVDAYPEIQQAIQYLVDEQVFRDGEWVDTGAKPLAEGKQEYVIVGDARVEMTPRALYSWPIATSYREPVEDRRIRIRWRPILPAGATDWIVYGTYQQGRLTDGNLQRLLVMTAERKEEILGSIASGGKIKAVVLVGVALTLCLLVFFNLRRRNVE